MEKTFAHSPEHTLTALQWKKDKKEKNIKLLNILIITCLLFKRKKVSIYDERTQLYTVD